MKIPIAPQPSFPGTATQLECVSFSGQLGVGVNGVWRLLDANDKQVSQLMSSDLNASQYAQWTGDDAFVCRCLAQNAGLTPL